MAAKPPGGPLQVRAALPSTATGGIRPGAAGAAGNPAPATGTPMQCPPALFKSPSNDLRDCEYQRAMHNELNGFIDAICRALAFGFDLWRQQARFAGIVINGPVATAGRLEGPAIEDFVRMAPDVQALSGWCQNLRDGVARGFGGVWQDFCRSVTVPGLPWYPAFAAFPGPMAPPTPNVPTPFITLTQAHGLLTPSNLANAMVQKAPGNTLYAQQVFTAVAEQLHLALLLWRPAQQVRMVMGKGPIPTFAPPYVPVGPVVGGDNISAPGHLMA
jgi:hypothetical protein